MITNTGKSIIVKYLLGQTQSYASYIAVGCGAKPLAELSFSITDKQLADGLVTLTTSAQHGFSTGDVVTISGVGEGFDGVFTTVIGTGTNVIKYNIVDTVSSVSAGTDVVPNGKVSYNYSNKTSLDFEMFRAPITSRGYIKEDGMSKVVLTANLPAPERYEITEVGVFPAAANPAAQSSGSQNVFSFSGNEDWAYHSGESVITIPTVTERLDPNEDGTIAPTEAATTSEKAFLANSSNATFSSDVRLARHERPRNLDESIFIRGDLSEIVKTVTITTVDISTPTTGFITYTTNKTNGLIVGDTVTISGYTPDPQTYTVTSVDVPNKKFTVADSASSKTGTGIVTLPRYAVASGNHIHNSTNINLPFSNSSPTDELRFAFAIVSKDETDTGSDISFIRFVIEFSNTSHQPGYHSDLSAELNIELENSVDYPFETNRYYSIAKQFKDVLRIGNFNWQEADEVSVYASVINSSGVPMSNYYVALDGFRLENTSSVSPVYGLVGYSVIKNTSSLGGTEYPQAITKLPNTSSFVEFRYSLDVI